MSFLPGLGLQEAFVGPTHLGHALDRIYTSIPMYQNSQAVASSIKTKHSAVLATTCLKTDSLPNDTRRKISFRKRTPGAYASLHNTLEQIDWDQLSEQKPIDIAFTNFYRTIQEAMDSHFPVRTITLGRKDPCYMTPYLKHLIRRRNTLFRRHKKEEADAIAKRIGDYITKETSISFDGLSKGSKHLWEEVRRVSGNARESQRPAPDDVTCHTLNEYYQSVSTDHSYIEPRSKQTVSRESPIEVTRS